MSFEKSDRSYLEQDELKTLYSKEFASDRLEKVRDVFLFSCYTGISFAENNKSIDYANHPGNEKETNLCPFRTSFICNGGKGQTISEVDIVLNKIY